jgi:hypothetical protein
MSYIEGMFDIMKPGNLYKVYNKDSISVVWSLNSSYLGALNNGEVVICMAQEQYHHITIISKYGLCDVLKKNLISCDPMI